MLKPTHIPFYLQGRNAKPIRHSIVVAELAQKVIDTGDTPLTVALAAADQAAKASRWGRNVSAWARGREAEIAAAGEDVGVAHRHFMQGITDELAAELDALICEELEEGGEDEGEDDDEDEDSEDEEGDEP